MMTVTGKSAIGLKVCLKPKKKKHFDICDGNKMGLSWSW